MEEYGIKQKEKFTIRQSIKKISITTRDQVIKQTENYRKSQPVRKKENNRMVSAAKSNVRKYLACEQALPAQK